MSKKQIKNKQTETAAPTIVQELFMPKGMKLLVGLLLVGGLSGLMLGLLVWVQAGTETFWDIQTYLTIESVGLIAFGTLMFILATTLFNKISWSLSTAKIAAIGLVGWSIPAIVIATYTAYILDFTDALILYVTIGWVFVFGIGMGIPSINYIIREGPTLMKYIRYSPPEIYTPAPMPVEKPVPRKMLTEIKPRVKTFRCLDCNGFWWMISIAPGW